MKTLQPPSARIFDRTARGVFGRFGTGMGMRVCFLQTGITSHEIENIALVHEIPGSDRWPVRDLFQREVDHERVANGLLPWLQDESKVKFFNPLTLTLLPLDPETGGVVHAVPELVCNDVTDANGQCWRSVARPPYYCFSWLVDEAAEYPEYGKVEWSSQHVRLVAIDGQHRVSALKRFVRDSGGPGHDGLMQWSIPVVITGLERVSGSRSAPGGILDVIRSMFVYINTQARTITESRQILLNDEHISYLCTQELLEYAHSNDVIAGEPSHDPKRLPLLFLDWRGETRDCQAVRSPAALKSIVEISEWMKHYVLGTALDQESAEAFGVVEESDPLWETFESHEFDPEEAGLVRRRFDEHILPGLCCLLENFTPYAAYVAEVRDLENRWSAEGDVSRHALSRLRFGTHSGTEAELGAIDTRYRELVQDLIDVKMKIPHVLAQDIGMRGVVYAFGVLRSWFLYWREEGPDKPWLPFSEWFVRQLNRAYRDGWFGADGSQHRRFITNNANDNLQNYRIEDAKKALGALVAILVCAYARAAREEVGDDQFEEVWEDFAESTLSGTLRASYKSYHRARLNTEHPNWPKGKMRTELDSVANKAVHKHLSRLKKAAAKVTP